MCPQFKSGPRHLEKALRLAFCLFCGVASCPARDFDLPGNELYRSRLGLRWGIV